MNAAEAGRIVALRRFDALDGSPEPVFDRIAALAADLFAAPIGLVTLIDETRLVIKGGFGLSAATFPRDHLPWPDAMGSDAPVTVVIADTAADPRYRDAPFFTGDPRLRFYAAAALVTPDGFRIGAVSAIDRRPRAPPPRRDIARLKALAGIVMDELDLRRAHRAALESGRLLRDSEAHYRLLAEQAADIIVTTGLDGRITFVSPAVEAIGGRVPVDLRGVAALDLVHPDDRASLRRHFVRMRRQRLARSPNPAEFRARHADGRWVWLEANSTLVIDPASGEPSGWVDIMRDIGLRKVRDIERTAARRAAEDSARAKSDFLANMSHEIRTPLNSIIGFTQVLKRDATLGESQLSQVNRIVEAGRSLLTVVNDVLELSKLESGTLSIAQRVFSPAKLVRDTAALMRPQAADKGLGLVVEIAPDAATSAIGDPDRLRQILLNLLSNAVKFTGAGEVRLKVEARIVGAAIHLAMAVEDNGIGIAPEQIPNLFQRYTQANGSIGRRFGGTGLGLAISKRLAEAMDATIEVESTPKVGSRFLVSLVLPVAAAPAGRGASLDRLLEPARMTAMRGKRLLVAEDVAINRKLVQAILSSLGCAVDTVGNGDEALAAVQRQDYALVLMDMEMPELDGLEATRAIRALGGRFAQLPIVALTANVFPEQSDRARAAGMDDLITKPIDADHLIETVVRWSTGQHHDGDRVG